MIAALVEERIDSLDNHITWSFIAKKLNLSKSALSKFKNSGNELGFNSTLELCEMLHPNNFVEVMSSWCLKFKKPSNVKLALEFLSINRYLTTLETYIDELNTSNLSSAIIKELADVYSTLLIHQKQEEREDFIEITKQKSYKNVEPRFLKIMSEIYYLHRHSSELGKIISLIQRADEVLLEMEDSSIKDRYIIRLCEMKSIVSLFKSCNPLESREYSERILKEIKYYCDKFAGDSYYRIGMSYFYESPDMCLAYLQKASRKLINAGFTKEADNILINEVELLKIHWDLIENSDELSNKPSKAHFFAKNNKIEEAEVLLKDLDQNSPFTVYYKGLANMDINLLIESALMFKNKSNLFYAELPLRVLEKTNGMSGIIKQIRI
jgi:hypothetical protein